MPAAAARKGIEMNQPQMDDKNGLLNDMLGDFLDESDLLLAQLNANLLQLDEWALTLEGGQHYRCEDGLLNEMFRSAHSLKGLSAMLGLTDINQLTHKIENVFDAARHDKLNITPEVTELLFMGLDRLSAMIGLLKEPDGEPVDCVAVLEAIRQTLQIAGVEKLQMTQADAQLSLRSATCEGAAAIPAADAGSATARHSSLFDGINDDDDISDKYLYMFVDEAEASLDALTSELLSLEGGRCCGELKNLLGTAHKIKGSAASIGLNRVAKLAHLMEDVFESVDANGELLSPQTIDVLLLCADGLRRHVGDLRFGRRGPDQLGQLAFDLLATISDRSVQGVVDGIELPLARQDGPDTEMTAGGITYVGEVAFQHDSPNAGLTAQLIYEKLVKVGDVCDCQPEAGQLNTIDHLSCFRFRLTTDQSREEIVDQLHVSGVVRVSMEPVATQSTHARLTADKSESTSSASAPETSQLLPEGNQRTSTTGQRPAETVRVDTDRLDELMDLAGQLVINKAQLSQIGGRLRTVVDCNQAVGALDKLSGELDKLGSGVVLRWDSQYLTAELDSMRAQVRRLRSDLEPIRREVKTVSRARDAVRALFEAIHHLNRVSDGIQKRVMDIRMVPIGPLFARFNRVVRDISRASGKQVRLEITGEKTELDKRMIDELADPLVHLVRNSADHGIEPPDEREAAGKPRQGTVTLNAFHRGNRIVIEVRDDGKGLDAERILRKAIDKGLVTEADAQSLSNSQIYQLIWKPGLSTADRVTDVSGRGMGMDIVKTKIDELSGTVDISSERGGGTTITIKLPLTLAILPSLMVEIAGGVFAMPMEAVTEIVNVGRNCVRTAGGRPMATVRERVVPVVRLGDLLSFRHGCVDKSCHTPETTLVVVSDAGQELGLAVDRVIGEEDVVIKSLAENFQNIPGIAGASILGDGRVALILDIPALITTLAMKTAHESSLGSAR
jgi:two-component system chemotaxis sensor kinase CheA